MKTMKNIKTIVAAFLLTSLLAACGGGGGGGGTPPAPPPLPTGAFTKTVALSAPGDGNWTGLFQSGAGTGSRYQGLVRAQDIRGSGPIATLSLKLGASSSGNSCPNVTIKIGHTSKSSLDSTTYANNVEEGRGSLVTVFGPAALSVPNALAGGFIPIPLTGSFSYNGVDNLVVEIATDRCTTSTVLAAQAASPAYTALIWSNSSPIAATGSIWNALADMRFTFAGGEDRVAYPFSVGNLSPFGTVAAVRHAQMLHLASDINGSGPITGIAMISTEAPTDAASYTVTITLGHTTLSALTTTFASNFNSGAPVTVASGLTFTVPAGVPAGTPIWLPLPGMFTYNGTDNLIVDIEVADPVTESTIWAMDDSVASRRLFAAVGAATGTVQVGAYHTVFRFHGGPVSVITDGLAFAVPFDTDAGGAKGYLNLYRAAELGSAGTITSVACRLENAGSTAASYANYRVIIGHSNMSSLDGAPADNFVSQNTVFNGTVSVPAGLVRGDWIEVPLSRPFAYDGRSNLAIWMGTTDASGAVSAHYCLTSAANAARYPGQLGFGAPGAASVSVSNIKFDMKLMMTR